VRALASSCTADVASSDICINNTLAIRNTRLLKAYVDADPRVSTMIFFVKHVRFFSLCFYKQRNDPVPRGRACTTVGKATPAERPVTAHAVKARAVPPMSPVLLTPSQSYGWVLLIINFLQRKGLLPVLQLMSPHGAHVDSPDNLPSVQERAPDGRVHETYFFGDADSPHFAGEVRARALPLPVRLRLTNRTQRLVWAKRLVEALCVFFSVCAPASKLTWSPSALAANAPRRPSCTCWSAFFGCVLRNAPRARLTRGGRTLGLGWTAGAS